MMTPLISMFGYSLVDSIKVTETHAFPYRVNILPLSFEGHNPQHYGTERQFAGPVWIDYSGWNVNI
jgi:hypothetical protein